MSLPPLSTDMRLHAAAAPSRSRGLLPLPPLYISAYPVFPGFIHLCQSCGSVCSDSVLPSIHSSVHQSVSIPPNPAARRVRISISEGPTSLSSTEPTFPLRSSPPATVHILSPPDPRGSFLQSGESVISWRWIMEVCHMWQRRIIKVWSRADLRRFNILPAGGTLKEGHGMFSVRSKIVSKQNRLKLFLWQSWTFNDKIWLKIKLTDEINCIESRERNYLV